MPESGRAPALLLPLDGRVLAGRPALARGFGALQRLPLVAVERRLGLARLFFDRTRPGEAFGLLVVVPRRRLVAFAFVLARHSLPPISALRRETRRAGSGS